MYQEVITTRMLGERALMWPRRDVNCYDAILRDWYDHWPIISRYITDTEVVVQAGGNCGLYPLLYSNTFDRVFTFEPEPMNFYCLAANCNNNKIIKFNTALGNEPRFLKMGIYDTNNVGMARIGAGDIVVYSMSLDSLNLSKVSLIHLDIEGYELQALQGAVETIKKCRPVVVAEMLACREEIEQLMAELDYQIAVEFGAPINVLFVPKERLI